MANTTSDDTTHFDISAAVVRQLGEELVTDEVTAIMELVKNSYDACADWVKIEVNTAGRIDGTEYRFNGEKGYITIEDNGSGMNGTEIKKGWMVISLSDKRKMKEAGEKTPCGRTPLGDKGLGRLSTQRLAQKLEMFTSRKEEAEVHHVAFDWADFNDETPLTKVPTHYNELSKKIQPKGTKLILAKLRDIAAWTGQPADKFKGQLSQLIFPFKEKRVFNVYLTINTEKVDLDEISDALRNQAVSRFNFKFSKNKLIIGGLVKLYKLSGGSPSIDDKETYTKYISEDSGKNFFSFLTDPKQNKSNFLDNIEYSGKGGILYTFEKTFDLDDIPDKNYIITEDKNKKEKEFANPGNFHGELDDFNLREADSLDSAFDNFSQYKNIVKNQIGVRVFRDGFGIKPFGIDGEDWLQLGSGQTGGSSFYGLRPYNTIGFVALTAEENKNLREKTDREGFMDTPYSKNFSLLMEKVVDTINDSLERTRRSYNDYKRKIAQETGNISDIKQSYQRLKDTSSKAKSLQTESKKITPALTKVQSSVKQVLKRVQNTKPVNTEDAEQRKLLAEIDESLGKAMEILKSFDSILEVAKQLEHDVNYIKPKVEDLENQLTEFSELAGLGLTAEALSHEISNIVDRLLEQTESINKKVKGKDTIDTSPVFVYVEYVKSAIKSFRKQLSHLAPSLRYVRESKEEFSVNKYFEDVVDYYGEKYKEQISVIVKYSKDDFKIRMSKGKLTQVIDNIILNSEYWLKEKGKGQKNFHPEITIDLTSPFIKIYDNGFGVDPSYENRIFQPFVSAKPKHIGRGLGLFIVQQLLDTIGGEVILLNERNEHKRRYIFQINLSEVII